jgi:hypothetical protein
LWALIALGEMHDSVRLNTGNIASDELRTLDDEIEAALQKYIQSQPRGLPAR